MSSVLPIFLFVGILLITKSANADEDLCNDIGRSDTLPSLECLESTTLPAVDECDNLKDGKQYYIKTPDGRFVVHNAAKSFAFMENVDVKHASKFTATQVDCNTYGLCVDGFCMSRCMACSSYTWDLQTVKFHLTNSDEPYSRWTFTPAGNDGEYNLETDRSFGYLTYKNSPVGYQLTLTPQLSDETKFIFVEVPVEKLSPVGYQSTLTPQLSDETEFISEEVPVERSPMEKLSPAKYQVIRTPQLSDETEFIFEEFPIGSSPTENREETRVLGLLNFLKQLLAQ